MRKLTLPAIVLLAFGLVAMSANTSEARGFHFSGGGIHFDIGNPHGGHHVYHGGGHGFHGGHGGSVWHDTTHLDYHPAEYTWHGNHWDYQPAHYDVHRTGHWDHLHW